MLDYMLNEDEFELIEYDELETEASAELHCLCGISSGAGA